MQYLPGFTVQCINPVCDARGHWLRADATGPISDDGRCPCCGDFLRNVPPPLSPRFRMRPRPLPARPPLPPRPRFALLDSICTTSVRRALSPAVSFFEPNVSCPARSSKPLYTYLHTFPGSQGPGHFAVSE